MRLTIVILIASLLQVSASTLAQKITLSKTNSELSEILEELEQQSGYVFLYRDNVLKKTKPITINLRQVEFLDALNEVFKNQPLEYIVNEKTITLKPKEDTFIENIIGKFFDSVKIRGIVTDSLGVPLEGATVILLRGKPAGTMRISGNQLPPSAMPANQKYTTDKSGYFELTASTGDLVVVSYIGYKSYTFAVDKNERSPKKIVLTRTFQQLAEVMVQTGYQKLSKERATGSFSKPDMKTFARRTSSMDLIGRLDGQIPGLTLGNDNKINTANGSQTRSAIIRGLGSIRLSTEPLYVVNGVIVSDFSSINMDDVEDITVLKDAAAAAIWGAQASNGVVVVTTKSGQNNEKIKLSYSGFTDFRGKPNLDYQRFLTSSEYIQAARETFNPTANPYSSLFTQVILPHEQIMYDQLAGKISSDKANGLLDSLSKINNKSQIKDLWFRNGITQNHTVSASGGGSKYNFYASLGYTGTQSTTPGETDNTYRLSFNQSFEPSERISISLSTQIANSLSTRKNPITIGAEALPYLLFKDAQGNNVNMPYLFASSPEARIRYQGLSKIDLEHYSPLDEMNYGNGKTNNLSINVVANTKVKIWKGISFLGTYGYLTNPVNSILYEDHAKYQMRKSLLTFTVAPTQNSVPVYNLPEFGGTQNETNNLQRNWTVRNQLVYNYSGRGNNDLITIQVGQEANERYASGTTSTILGYDQDLQSFPLIDYKRLRDGIFGTVTGFASYSNPQYQFRDARSRFTSYFALGSYTFNQKYSVDASWRVDKSNLFGSDVSAQNKPVYSFGAKWNVLKEQFMKQFSLLNALAVRATYGITGNSPYIGSATTNDILSQESGSFTPLVAGKAYSLNFPANKKLSWEATHTINLGVDFAMLNNRLSGVIEYYRKNTSSLLGGVPTDPFVGPGSLTANIGKLENRGVNIGLTSVNLKTTDFTWSSGLAFAYNNNKLVEYTPAQNNQSGSSRITSIYAVGYALSPVFAYRYVGLDNVGDPQVMLENGTITKVPNAAAAKDLVYMGSYVPKFTGGLSNQFTYKQFELSFNMIYNFGAMMRKDVNQFYSGRFTGSGGNPNGNVSADFAKRWKKPGDENTTDIPSYMTNSLLDYLNRTTAYYTMSDRNVLSASYIKLRDAALAYNLDPVVLHWLKIKSATLRVQVSNVLLWKANKFGIDPEYQNYQLGFRNRPQNQHAITLGANINF